jgi:hypothetical protein
MISSMETEDENPFPVRFLLKNGIVKDVRQADIILGVFIVTIIFLSIFIFFYFSGTDRKGNLTTQESNFFNFEGGKKTTVEYDANLFGN